MTMCQGKELADSYLARLVACMERLFFEKHEVVPSLVAEFDHFVYKSVGKCITTTFIEAVVCPSLSVDS